jgi:hypothetical protein
MTDNSIVIQWALGALALLHVASFGVLWHLHTTVTKMEGILTSEDFGVVTILKELVKRVEALERRRSED